MKILVSFALDAEFAPWRKQREFHCIAREPYRMYEAAMGAYTLRIVLTGAGPEPARRAMEATLEHAPYLCISSGLAGGLKPMHRPGEILVARTVGELSGGPAISSDETLLAAAVDHGAKTVESFLTSPTLAQTAEDKCGMGAIADAVEMESFPVLAACRERGIPAVAIRAVSDAAETDLPYRFERALDEQGRIHVPRLLAQVARRPQRIPALVQFARQSRRAAAALAQFLDVYVGSLAAQMNTYEWESPVAAT